MTPSVGFTYINARTSSHTSTLGGTALGRWSRLKDEAAYVPVEVNIGYDAYVANDSKLNLNLNAGYAYNFDKDGVSGSMVLAGFQNPNAYAVLSREQGHHLFNVGGGATYSRGSFDVGVKYDYYRQSGADTHRVLGTVGIRF